MDTLVSLLRSYRERFPAEAGAADRFLEFAASGEPPRAPENTARHFTASAWIVSPDRSRVLLTHHRALGIWVQLGGHVEAGESWLDAALREAREESGLASFRVLDEGLFDLDLHPIPAKGERAAHFHYDLRFLFEADAALPLVVSKESKDLRWVALGELEGYSREESLRRMKAKTPRASV